MYAPFKISNALHEKYIYEHMTYTFVNGALQEWERIDPIHEDPLRVAMDAYFKAMELDEKAKLAEKIKESLIVLKGQLKREGVNKYYTANYDGALNSFENVLEVNSQEMFTGEMDTVMVQYSGIIAREIAGKTENNELYLKAIQYYKQLADADFGGANTYLQIKMDYMSVADTVSAMETLQEAIDDLPTHYRMIILLRHQQNLSYDEIAGTLEIPLGTVKARIHRAREMLKARLKKEDI